MADEIKLWTHADGRTFIRWERDGKLVVDRPAFGAEQVLAQRLEESHAERERDIASVIACLNEAFRCDPEALAALLCNRVPCRPAMRQTQGVQCSSYRPLPGAAVLGAFDLINSVLLTLGLPPVATQWSDKDERGVSMLIGFQVDPGAPELPVTASSGD